MCNYLEGNVCEPSSIIVFENDIYGALLLPTAPPPPENPGGPQQIEKAGSSVNLTIWPAVEVNGPIG